MPTEREKTTGKYEQAINKLFDEVWPSIIEGYVVLAREAFNAANLPVKIEDYQDTEKDYILYAIRFPTGVSEEYTTYSELVIVGTDCLDQEKMNRIALEISHRSFFQYHLGHEELFSRSVYVVAPQYKGFVRARKLRNQFFVPVLGELNAVLPFVYFADFLKSRIDAVMNRILHGWRKCRRDHVVYRTFEGVLNLSIQRGGSKGLSDSRALLYYIHIIESKAENIVAEVSDTVLTTIKILTSVFKKALKYADSLLSPFLKQRLRFLSYLLLRKAFGHLALTAAKAALEHAQELDRVMAQKVLDRLSRATPVKG
jgi:hypothetical protein